MLDPDRIRRYVEAAEVESRRFYERAAACTSDADTRQLLDDLAQAERTHEQRAETLEREPLPAPRARRRSKPGDDYLSSRSCNPDSPD